MEQASSKHSPVVDDEMKAETRGLVQGGHSTRAEEWHDPEPSGEDEPDADRVPDGTFTGGTPEGMTEDDVARRSELAGYLDRSTFPAGKTALLDGARANNAPDVVVAELERLPDDGTFENVQAIWSALGHGTEQQRF